MSEEIRPNYTRVSNILSMYSDYDSISPLVLAKAAERGSEIHGLCQLYAEDGIRLPSPYTSYIDAFTKYFDREVEEVLEIEKRLYCDTYEITGQFDLLVKAKNEKLPLLIDIKTCVATHKSWLPQTAAYAYLAKEAELHGGKYVRCVLHIKKDGSYKLYKYENDQRDLELFMCALRLHRYFNV